ncbi:MAG: LysM peptidoglycan-binding domain-containing protein [Phycisphaeraceae bacterium]|nr:LysM peptidoglycan-binding domain-containing protein [Phycisphaeraceae bacterium]
MTRETKIGLLAGMGIILLIGIVVSDLLVVPAQEAPLPLRQFAPGVQENINVRQTESWQPAAPIENRPKPRVNQPIPTPTEINRIVADAAQQPPAAEQQANAAPAVQAPAPEVKANPAADQAIADATAKRPTVGGDVTLPTNAVSNVVTLAKQPATVSVRQPVKTITVDTGDTLYSLAQKHLGSSSRHKELFEANKAQLKSPDELKIGMVLILPAAPQPAAVQLASTSDRQPTKEITTPATSGGTSGAASGGTTVAVVVEKTPKKEKPAEASSNYTVKANDTLYAIAQKVYGDGKRWHEIQAANKAIIGPDAAKLQIGQVLKIPR